LTSERWLNLLSGNSALIQGIRDGLTEEQIAASWKGELENYLEIRKKYLLYPDSE